MDIKKEEFMTQMQTTLHELKQFICKEMKHTNIDRNMTGLIQELQRARGRRHKQNDVIQNMWYK